MADNVKAALRYAKAGYPVLLVWALRHGHCACPLGKRCPPNHWGKHPIENAWQKKATTDPAKIEQAFRRWPSAHIGIMAPEGCSIIDVDPRNGGGDTIKALLGNTKVPSTPVQHSGGGGLHMVFKGEPAGPLGQGIDIKKHGKGYVVAWPAVHSSGGLYEWREDTAPWDVKPAPLPTTLQGGRARTERNDSFDTTATTVPLETVRAALAYVNADEYAQWINIGQALRHNYGDAGEEVWVEWSKTSSAYNEGDEEKWDTFDRNRDGRPLITVRSIMSLARRKGYRPLVAEFNQSLWALGDISGMLDTEAPPIDWIMQPCMPAGKVILLAGAGGSSKSYLALTLSMQLAIEQAFGTFVPSKGGKALLMVAEEDKQDVHRRLRAILNARKYTKAQQGLITDRVGIVSTRGMDWRLVFHDDAGDLHETERVDYLIDELCGLGDVRLLVLDPLVAFNGANENDNMEMARLMFTLDRIAARTGAAVLVLHHVSKGGQITSLNDATQAVVRGASALVDNARATILLTRMPRADAPLYNIAADQAGRYVVARIVKNNYGPHAADMVYAIEAGGALRLAPEVVRVHATAAAAARAMQEADAPLRVLRAIYAQPDEDQGVWAAAIGVSQPRVSTIIAQLVGDKCLTRTGVGRATRFELTQRGRDRISDDSGAGNDASEDASDLF